MENEKPAAELGHRVIVAVLTLFGASLVVFTAQLAMSVVSTYLPLHAMDNLGLQTASLGMLLVIGQAAMILSALLAGFLADRVGRRWLSVVGALVLGISVTATGLATSMPALTLAYVGMSIGASILLVPLVAQMFRDTGTHWLLATVAALYFMMTQLGSVASAGGVALIEQVGVSTALLIAGATTLVGAGIGMGFVGASHLVSRRVEWRDEWLDRAGDKVQSTSLVLVLAAVFLIGWAASTIQSFAGIYATEQLGLQPSELSRTFSVFVVAPMMIALWLPFAGMAADLLDWLTLRTMRRQLGRQLVVAIGILIVCIALGILLTATGIEGVADSMIAGRLGAAIVGPALFALVIARAPHRLWGTMSGLYIAASAAGSVGIVASGLVADALGWPGSFGLAIIVAVLALLLIAVASLSRPAPQRPPDPTPGSPSG